jgi:hypothetical protein
MITISRVLRLAVALLAGLAAAMSVQSQNVLDTQKGKGGSDIQGSAGTQGAQGAAGDLERCDKPMGAMAVVEPQDYVMAALSQYQLQSPVGLIRMIIQQSNCFIVVERGQGMQNMMQERALSGGGALGGLLGGKSAVLGAVAGGLKFKEAQTSLLVADARSGVQVASAEGSSKKADLGLGAAAFGGGAAGGLGGYANTNEGKIIAASFADNYNNIVRVVKNDPSLQRDVGTLAQEAAAGGTTQAGAVFNVGDVLYPKIGGVKLMGSAADAGKAVASFDKGEEMIFMGTEENGFLKVESGKGSGWVKKVLVSK